MVIWWLNMKNLNSYKFLLSTFLFLLIYGYAQANSLEFYRKKFKQHLPKGYTSVEAVQFEAKKRISSLRKILGTEKLIWKEVGNKTFRNSGSPQTGRKVTSSGIIKPYLDRAAEILQNEKMTGRPKTFDPGRIPNSRLRRIERAKNALKTLNEVLSSSQKKISISQLVQYYQSYIDYKNHLKKTQIQIPLDVTDNEKRVELVQSYLRANEPKEERTNIEAVIGRVDKVEVLDGFISKIYFKGEQNIGLSLSMLITFKTGRDDYFIDLLSGLKRVVAYITAKDKEEDAETERLWRGDRQGEIPLPKPELVKILSEKLIGARYANHILKKLSRKQINFLLDLFLQGMGSEIWAQSEIQFSDGGNEKSSTYAKIVEGALSDTFVKNQMNGDKQTVQNDMVFYSLIDKQLTGLEIFLRLRSGIEKGYEKEMERLRKKK